VDTKEYLYEPTRETYKRMKEKQIFIPQRRIVVEKVFLDEEHITNNARTIMDVKNNDIVIR